jgi:hypothetical protein
MHKGQTWLAVFKGHETLGNNNFSPFSISLLSFILFLSFFLYHTVDPMSEENVKKQLMLERFQQENPGFDFSGAEFSGGAPDPKTFMVSTVMDCTEQ